MDPNGTHRHQAILKIELFNKIEATFVTFIEAL